MKTFVAVASMFVFAHGFISGITLHAVVSRELVRYYTVSILHKTPAELAEVEI
jgi:hypothetical protein